MKQYQINRFRNRLTKEQFKILMKHLRGLKKEPEKIMKALERLIANPDIGKSVNYSIGKK
jgi:hypothetical protein